MSDTVPPPARPARASALGALRSVGVGLVPVFDVLAMVALLGFLAVLFFATLLGLVHVAVNWHA